MKHIIYVFIIFCMFGLWVSWRGFYSAYIELEPRKVKFVADATFTSGSKRATAIWFKSINKPRAMILNEMKLEKEEVRLLVNLNQDCVVTEGYDTYIYNYVPLEITSCSGKKIFERSNAWYVASYRTFSIYDKAGLAFSLIGLFICLYNLKKIRQERISA
jgi:hypothetical protein